MQLSAKIWLDRRLNYWLMILFHYFTIMIKRPSFFCLLLSCWLLSSQSTISQEVFSPRPKELQSALDECRKESISALTPIQARYRKKLEGLLGTYVRNKQVNEAKAVEEALKQLETLESLLTLTSADEDLYSGVWNFTFPDPVYNNTVTLKSDGTAAFGSKTPPLATGTWKIINKELRVDWTDGNAYVLTLPKKRGGISMVGTQISKGNTKQPIRLDR